MAAELRVNFNTIARAYRMLDEAGLLSTQQGRGTYIIDQPVEEKTATLKKDALEVQLAQFLILLARQGYSPSEVEPSLQRIFATWKDGNLQVDHQNES